MQGLEIDVFDLLGGAIGRFSQALRQQERTEYVAGQLAYLDAALERIRSADPDAPANAALESAAADLDVEVGNEGPNRLPVDARDAGILSMWALCLGYVEGLADGAERVMRFVDTVEGAHGSFERR